jgi:asparagine synthase (glutamine-hydrolysing)
VSKYAKLLDLPLESYYYGRTSSPHNFFNKNSRSLFNESFGRDLSSDCTDGIIGELMSRCNGLSTLDKMLYVDLNTWLPDDLLIKADKITMANSLELRVPLLDHKVLEFAASLPDNAKLNGLTTKHILKKVLSPRVPKEIISRKKTGFPVPYERWLKNEFRKEALDILLDRRTLERGYFDKSFMRNFVEKEYSSNQSNPKEIFSLICLEMWQRIFIDQPAMSCSAA